MILKSYVGFFFFDYFLNIFIIFWWIGVFFKCVVEDDGCEC